MLLKKLTFIVIASFCLLACEEKKDEKPSFSRSGASQNLAIDEFLIRFPDYYSQYLLVAGNGRTCSYYPVNALRGPYLSCWGRSISRGDQVGGNVPGNTKSLSIGEDHVCTRFVDHGGVRVGCDGANGDGQATEPSPATGMGDGFWSSAPAMVASGRAHNCLIDTYGVYCWGSNNKGQTELPKVENPLWVAAGGDNSCALQLDGNVVCWGDNQHGQLNIPASIQGNATHLDVGDGFVCAIASEHVTCWGKQSTPAELSVRQPSFVSVGQNHACVIEQESDDKSIRCFGNNDYGQLDMPSFNGDPSYEVVSVSAGYGYTCAQYRYVGYPFTGGTVKNTTYLGSVCRGKNDEGQSQVPERACVGYHASAEELENRYCPPQ